MLEWILKYRRLGLSVIPIKPGQKLPLVAWQEYQKRIATEDEIRRWYQTWPDMNIGIVTGQVSGLAVIDVDGSVGKNSKRSLNLSSPTYVLSGNGEQLYYRWPEGKTIRNSVKQVAPGIDIRGEGGMVVAPPSIHPNGKRYCWAGSGIVTPTLLPQLPSIVLEPAQGSRLLSAPGNGAGWISDALKEMKYGNIDNTLFKICSRLRADGYSEFDALTLLGPHAIAAGATAGHLEEKVRNVWSRYPEGRSGSLRLPRLGASPQSEVPMQKSETLSGFLEKQEKVEWICEPFIAKRSIGFVAGLPETLKTWLLIDLAVELTRDAGRWVGLFPTGKETVLFIDQERFKGETQRRFAAVIAEKGLGLPDTFYIRCGSSVKLDDPRSYEAFRAELHDLRPGVVFIDSFATLHSSPDNDRTAMQQVMERLKELRNEIGCSFVIIHHENKMAYPHGEPEGIPNAGTIAGSGALIAAAEFALVVRKTGPGVSLVHHVKSTLAQASAAFYASVVDTPSGIQVKGIN